MLTQNTFAVCNRSKKGAVAWTLKLALYQIFSKTNFDWESKIDTSNEYSKIDLFRYYTWSIPILYNRKYKSKLLYP